MISSHLALLIGIGLASVHAVASLPSDHLFDHYLSQMTRVLPGQVSTDSYRWFAPLPRLDLTCIDKNVKAGGSNLPLSTCIEAGEAICIENEYSSFGPGQWTFGITKDNQLRLWNPKNEIVWSFCKDITHVCIGEDHENNPARYSDERPFLFFYNDKTHTYEGQLTCDGTDGVDGDNIGRPSMLKMVNNDNLGTYVKFPVQVVKFKKGQTPNPDDDNALWSISVGSDGFPTQFISFDTNKCEWQDECVHCSTSSVESTTAVMPDATFDFDDLPLSDETVEIKTFVRGDLNSETEFFLVFGDTTIPLGINDGGNAGECRSDFYEQTFSIDSEIFNSWILSGQNAFQVLVHPSKNVDYFCEFNDEVPCTNCNQAYVQLVIDGTVDMCPAPYTNFPTISPTGSPSSSPSISPVPTPKPSDAPSASPTVECTARSPVMDISASNGGIFSFSFPSLPPATYKAELRTNIRGDFNGFDEYADFYWLNGTDRVFIGRNNGGQQCGTDFLEQNFLITAEVYNSWLAVNSTIDIILETSFQVNDFCTFNDAFLVWNVDEECGLVSSAPSVSPAPSSKPSISSAPSDTPSTSPSGAPSISSAPSSQCRVSPVMDLVDVNGNGLGGQINFTFVDLPIASQFIDLDTFIRGDYGFSSEFADFFLIDGTSLIPIGTNPGPANDCGDSYHAASFNLDVSAYNDIVTRDGGTINIMMEASEEVNYFCSDNDAFLELNVDGSCVTSAPSSSPTTETKAPSSTPSTPAPTGQFCRVSDVATHSSSDGREFIYTIENAPVVPPGETIRLTSFVRGDLGSNTEYFDVILTDGTNEENIGRNNGGNGNGVRGDCTADFYGVDIEIPRATYNAWLQNDGSLQIKLQGSNAVGFFCDYGSEYSGPTCQNCIQGYIELGLGDECQSFPRPFPTAGSAQVTTRADENGSSAIPLGSSTALPSDCTAYSSTHCMCKNSWDAAMCMDDCYSIPGLQHCLGSSGSDEEDGEEGNRAVVDEEED